MPPSSSKISKMVECMMCARPLRVKLLGNHLMNQHKVGPDQLGLVAKWHLNKKCLKLAKKVKIGTQKKVKNCHKKPMKRSSLKKRFEDAMSGEYFGMDVFSKLLMDVSRDYHTSIINRGIEDKEIEKTFNDASILNADYKGDLKFKVNRSSQKLEKSFSNDTIRLLDDSPMAMEEKGLLTATLSESVFLPIQDLTTMNEDKTMNVSLTKKTNVSKLKASKATKMKTSTPRQTKKRVLRINKKSIQE